MRQLELLAPARDLQIGIAAIDCGADAVYIAGPRFGARQAAGNEIEDIRQLCDYAHKFGAKIFITLNTILYDPELAAAYRFMLDVQEAGADAIIVQDLAVVEMARNGFNGIFEPLRIPLHASTQCSIRTPEQARWLESLGFSRLILERELSLEQIRAIRAAVTCELEFFVHGAICVCYNGQCYLSENIAGRSANRGACIQACRSKYDLVDASGKVLVRDKALLSLKDYNLRGRLRELAEAGITSFKIEGRLKNESYVRNVVRDYSLELDRIIESSDDFERGAWGRVSGGFTPNTNKTFNRGYTELFIDGKKGKWAAMDAAKGMGEDIGEVTSLNKDKSALTLRLRKGDITLNNGDGFSFVARNGDVLGFRGDVCEGNTIRCKAVSDLFVGARIFRNIDAAFEKEIEKNPCRRELLVNVSLDCRKSGVISVSAISEDSREVCFEVEHGGQIAENRERMEAMFASQISKSAGHYRFHLSELLSDGPLPFMSASALNGIRRSLAEELDKHCCLKKDILCRLPGCNPHMHKSPDGDDLAGGRNVSQKSDSPLPFDRVTYKQNIANKLSAQIYREAGAEISEQAYELSHRPGAELMRTKYCIRHELGICPVHQKGPGQNLPAHLRDIKPSTRLFLLNNGRRLALHFDCTNCEMTLTLYDGRSTTQNNQGVYNQPLPDLYFVQDQSSD